MRIGRLFLILFVLMLLPSLGGCTRGAPDASALLSAVLAEVRPLPVGRVYRISPEGGENAADEALLSAVLGEGSPPAALDAVSEGALYLSFTAPCEVALFYCPRADRTREVAQMCLSRLSRLRAYWEGKGEEKIPEGRVYVRGNWVILCFLEDSEAFLQAFRRAL